MATSGRQGLGSYQAKAIPNMMVQAMNPAVSTMKKTESNCDGAQGISAHSSPLRKTKKRKAKDSDESNEKKKKKTKKFKKDKKASETVKTVRRMKH